MDFNDEIFYIEFLITGIVKVDTETKKENLKKIQKLINKIMNDDMDLVKSESSLNVMSEAELMQSLMPYDDTAN